jgi:hypothetical protein
MTVLSRWSIAILFWCSACAVETTTSNVTCDLIVSPPPVETTAGETYTITGRPFTVLLDTSIRLNDTFAEVLAVERSECTLCDTCRAEVGCTACESCTECETSCETCEQIIDFVVPDVDPGTYTLFVRNGFGMSESERLTVDE